MKKLFLLLLVLAAFSGLQAQQDTPVDPPYKRFPKNIPLRLLLTDSTTYFTGDDLDKKKAVMIMLFSPDCDHCKHETESIIEHIGSFSKVQIVMSTTQPFEKMVEFYNKYDLRRFPNIVVGKDTKYMLPSYYDIKNLPFLAFYNKKKELISGFEGALPIEKILEELAK